MCNYKSNLNKVILIITDTIPFEDDINYDYSLMGLCELLKILLGLIVM